MVLCTAFLPPLLYGLVAAPGSRWPRYIALYICRPRSPRCSIANVRTYDVCIPNCDGDLRSLPISRAQLLIMSILRVKDPRDVPSGPVHSPLSRRSTRHPKPSRAIPGPTSNVQQRSSSGFTQFGFPHKKRKRHDDSGAGRVEDSSNPLHTIPYPELHGDPTPER